MTEKNEIIGIEAMCFKCEKIWNISLMPEGARSVTCEDCGGYVVSPSGKAQIRTVFEGGEIRAPLLDIDAGDQKEYRAEDVPRITDYTKFNKK